LVAQDNTILIKQVPFVGIENDIIHQITQDSTGLLWMASSDVWRNISENWYVSDGEKITQIPLPFENTAERFISGLYPNGPNGNFILGGDSVRVFNPYSHSIIQSIGIEKEFNPEGDALILHHVIYSSDNLIWAAFSPQEQNLGLWMDFTIVQSRNGDPFREIGIPKTIGKTFLQNMTAHADELFVATTDTIFQYDIDGHLIKAHTFPLVSFTPIAIKNQTNKEESVSFFHYAQSEKSKKFDKALYQFDVTTNEFKPTRFPKLNDLEVLIVNKTDDYYWALGPRMTFYRFSLDNEEPVDYSKSIFQQHPDLPYFLDYPHIVFQDKTNSLWVSTQANGILNIPRTKSPFTRYLAAKNNYSFCESNTCSIRGITTDNQENLYFTYDFGIQKIDAKTKELSSLNLNLSEPLESVYSLSFYENKLYLNDIEINLTTGECKNLISNYNNRRITHYYNNRRITHYLDKENDQIWIADEGEKGTKGVPIKLYRYDLKSEKTELIRVFEMFPNLFAQVSQFHLSPTTNTLFMATFGLGLYELTMEGETVQHFIDPEPFGPISLCLSLYEDDNQQLWIGQVEGLSKLDLKTRKISKVSYQGETSFESVSVSSIQRENETFAWMGTNKGLYRLNVENGKIRNFKMISSLGHIEFNRLSSYQSSEGNLYFGSTEGLFVFHPDSLLQEAQVDERFQVQLSRFSLFDNRKDTLIHTYKNLTTTSSFDIHPFHKYLSLEVFIPDYRDSEKNTFTYWLEGYESSWSPPSTSNTIRYDNLPAGNYTLHIRGGITSDYYEGSERQFEIIVHQIWYKSNWAYFIGIAALLGIVFGLNRYQVNQHKKRAEEKRLKDLDSLKSRFYTNITHEFRTPLTVIMGMTNNIRGHSQERELIQRNSENLLNLINQLLDLSKLESGSLKMNFIQADIVNYIRYLTESFYSMAREKDIHLTFYPEVKELIMDYDEEKIQHIVYNLLNNTIKFTPEKGKVILHLQELNKDNLPYLQMKISDTGIGISKENLLHIFDRFYQVESPQYRNESGTGIGLALAKELVEMMDGTIHVESKIGQGTEFLILLPVKKDRKTQKKDPKELEALVEKKPLISTPPLDLDKIHSDTELPSVLIIEDNRDVVTYIESILQKKYQIEIARNGQKGIDKALEIIPDIIISDVMMPEKNGYEVCEVLKNDERTSHIPIILLTAKADSKDRLEGLKGGADAYLTKPFNKEELFIRLNKLIELRQLLQERFSTNKFSTQNTPSKKELSLDDIFLQTLIKLVKERLNDQDLAVVHLCRAANLSNMQVNRKLKALTGRTPSRFIRSIRLQKAKELLHTTDANISEIAYKVGFNDPHFFSRAFSEEFGFPPSVIRK
jgi:signal transduction histidine kinase/DNA-binding response OmpR family regulator